MDDTTTSTTTDGTTDDGAAATRPLPLDEQLGLTGAADAEAPATTGATPTAATAYAAAPFAPDTTGPRIRWASVIWGLIFAASGWLTVWTLSSADRRAAFTDWTVSLSATGWIVAGVVTIGALILVGGLIGGLRRIGARR